MPSPEVIESLENLQKELEKLEPAIKHIEATVEVTRSIKEIPPRMVDFLKQMRESEDVFKNKLIGNFISELEKIRKSVGDIGSDVRGLINAIEEHLKRLTKLEDQIRTYFEEIKKINFPERLDKIDNTITSINIGLQNLQTVILNIVGSINEAQKTIIDSIEKKHSILMGKLDNQTSEIQSSVKAETEKISQSIQMVVKENAINLERKLMEQISRTHKKQIIFLIAIIVLIFSGLIAIKLLK